MSGKRVLLILVASIVGVFALVIAGFDRFGRARFFANSRLVEGKSNVVYLARGIAVCAEKQRALPESSRKVPEGDAVRGRAYASTAAEWDNDPTFSCARFRMDRAQYFQYEWERTNETDGVARARADFNGDGVWEATYEQELRCSAQKSGAFACEPAAFRDKN